MIDGLEYFSDVVSEQQEIDLLTYINKKGTWSNVMRRRVQHYGSVYQYKNASSTMPVEVPPVPDIFRQLAAQVVAGSEKITDKNWADSPQLYFSYTSTIFFFNFVLTQYLYLDR